MSRRGGGKSTARGGSRGHSTSRGGSRGHSTSRGGSRGHSTSRGGTSQGHSTSRGGSRGHSTSRGGSRGHSTSRGNSQGHSTSRGGSRGHSTSRGGSRGHSTSFGGSRGPSTSRGGSRGHSTSRGSSQSNSTSLGGGRGHNTSSGGSRGHSSSHGGFRGHCASLGGGRGFSTSSGSSRGHSSGRSGGRTQNTSRGGFSSHGASLNYGGGGNFRGPFQGLVLNYSPHYSGQDLVTNCGVDRGHIKNQNDGNKNFEMNIQEALKNTQKMLEEIDIMKGSIVEKPATRTNDSTGGSMSKVNLNVTCQFTHEFKDHGHQSEDILHRDDSSTHPQYRRPPTKPVNCTPPLDQFSHCPTLERNNLSTDPFNPSVTPMGHDHYHHQPPRYYEHTPPPPYDEVVQNDQTFSRNTSESRLTVAALVKTLTLFNGQFGSAETIGRQIDVDHKEIIGFVKLQSDFFAMMGEGMDTVIEFVPKIALCSDYFSSHGCTDEKSCKRLHICKTYVTEYCKLSPCQYGHRWDTVHNRNVLSMFHLNNISARIVHQVVKKVCKDDSKLNICSHYNSERGCRYLEHCWQLHICRNFVMNNGKCLDKHCKLNHDITVQHCRKLPRAFGMSVDETPRDILRRVSSSLEMHGQRDLLDYNFSEKKETNSVDMRAKSKKKRNHDSSTADESSDSDSSNSNVTQTKIDANKLRNIRSPASLSSQKRSDPEKDAVSAIPAHWTSMGVNQTHVLVPLEIASEEFLEVSGRLHLTLPIVKIVKIERLQNPYLWQLFQNRKALLSQRYDDQELNLQRLFHGTNFQNIETICKENFDWRQGIAVEQSFGQGTYFSHSAAVARGHCKQSDFGRVFLFLAQVIVGKVAQGNESLTSPLCNPVTKAPYDTTVDDTMAPTVFVKYDKDDYYPEYVIEFY